MKVHNRSPNSIPIVVGLSLLLIGVTQISALWALARIIVPNVLKTPVIEEVQPAKFSPQIYQLEITDNRIRLIPETIETTTTSPQIALQQAINKLLTPSPVVGFTTTIPQGTQLLNLQVNDKGIFLNLSDEFTKGGGSSSIIYRVGQVIYTATSIDPQAPVFLSIEGKPLNENYPLGGERTSPHLGLLLDYPLTRKQFNRDFLLQE
ncbi:MAG: GerMN domain-containing protein [Cyanobacteria bacterium P01_A01_bin.83]